MRSRLAAKKHRAWYMTWYMKEYRKTHPRKKVKKMECKGAACTLSYRACLSQHPGISLKENGMEMSRQLRRNLSSLFTPGSSERINTPFISSYAFNQIDFTGASRD